MRALLSLIGCCLLLQAVHAKYLPNTEAVPGGVVLQELPIESTKKPIALFLESPVTVLQSDSNLTWQALVGLPLYIKAKQHQIVLPSASQTVDFVVRKKDYGASRIYLKDKRFVQISPANRTRLQQESIKLNKLIKKTSDLHPFAKPFQKPVKGKISGYFGVKRIFNNTIQEIHDGIDIHAKRGTTVYPTQDGVVIGILDLFYLGKTVIIDHGSGVVSLYAHLDGIDVKEGRHLSQKTPIGTVGQTGRATGPHLHFGIALGGHFVNPGLFITKSNLSE